MPGTPLDELLAAAKTAKQTRRPHRDVNVTIDQAVAEQIEALDLRIEQLEQEQIDVAIAADDEIAEATRDARMASPAKGEIAQSRDEDLQRINDALAAAETERDQLTAGTVVTLRFTQIPGQAWAEIAARHPARADVTLDRVYGYNYHEVAKAAALYRDPGALPGTFGRGYADRVIPPEDDDAEPTIEPVSPEQMTAIFEIITGHEFERIASGIWDLNDYGPQQRIANAGKASRAGSVSRSS
jgi:hypothetical protein